MIAGVREKGESMAGNAEVIWKTERFEEIAIVYDGGARDGVLRGCRS